MGNLLGIVHTTSTTAPIGTHDYIYAQPNKTRKSQTSKADSLVNSSNNRSMDLQEDGRQIAEDDISEDDGLEELDEDLPNNEKGTRLHLNKIISNAILIYITDLSLISEAL